MRLIDADALNLKLQKEIGSPIDKKLYAVNLCIIEAPTVEAIPVKWLLDRLEEILNSGVLSGKPDDNLNIRSIIQVLRLWGIKMGVKA